MPLVRCGSSSPIYTGWMTRRAQSPVLIEATPKRQEILPTMTRLAGSGLSVTFVQALCKLTLASALAEERSTQTQHDPLLGKLCIYILSRRGKRKKIFRQDFWGIYHTEFSILHRLFFKHIHASKANLKYEKANSQTADCFIYLRFEAEHEMPSKPFSVHQKLRWSQNTHSCFRSKNFATENPLVLF